MASMSGDGATCKSEATDTFPVGLRVLVVDDDIVCLRILEQMLRKCKYSGVLPQTPFISIVGSFICNFFYFTHEVIVCMLTLGGHLYLL